MTIPFGLQDYSVREALAGDYEGTMAKVAEMGYRYMQLTNLGGRTPAEARRLLDGLGLSALATHAALPRLENELPDVIETAKELGYDRVCCPFLGEEFRSAEGYAKARDLLIEIDQKLAEHGMLLAYHNHSFEFAALEGGRRGFDILFDAVDPPLKSELDVYWVQHGGDDPVAWMNKLAGRVPILHLKDMEAGPDRNFAEVGTGVVDIAGIVRAAPAAGVEVMFIEQDGNWINGSDVESAKVSLENLTKIVEQEM